MASEEEILMPGKRFALFGGTVTVFPVGVRHLKKFGTTIARFLGIIGAEGVGTDQKRVLALLMPHIMVSAIDLFEECITCENIKFDDLPHWAAPPMIEYWVVESFGDRGKWEPWVKMVETLIERLTGEKTNLLDALSNFSSEPVTQEPIS